MCSALLQTRAFAMQTAMSALPPKADMCGATRYVRFVPIADIPLISPLQMSLSCHVLSKYACLYRHASSRWPISKTSGLAVAQCRKIMTNS